MSAENLTADVEQKVQDALTAIHGLGVIHGDVRLGNILVGNDGTVWFIDFESSIFAESIESAEARASRFCSDRDALTSCLKTIASVSKEININGNDYKVPQLVAC